ncbi:MAG: hypothetical protein ABS69_02020 [Nitrosomonadales bacterium SCN 54-20]|nr:MAG: hypothetical protein ABS69_02020 [Nitrosomonadales bacterium SCN 54-20]
MRKLLIVSAGLLLIFSLILVVAISLAIEDHPRVNRQVVLTPDHIERAKRIVDKHRYWVRPGMFAAARIMPADADLALNYLARRLLKGSAHLTLARRSAVIRLSIPLSETPLRRYLNIQASLVETDHLPQLRSIRIGKLALPDALADMLIPRILEWLRESPEYRVSLDSIRMVKVSPDELTIVYRWRGGLSHGMKASIIGEEERERLLRYQRLLVENSRTGEKELPLSDVLSPLMRAAAGQSTEADPRAENRALILVATAHVLGVSLKRILPGKTTWPRAQPQVVTLDGRDDFAKHFMVSAAIAAYADTALADAIGLYKEFEDSRHGSGFSFNDLAADHAGTKFGEKAVASETSAQQLQYRVLSGIGDTDLMPSWSDLPEFMPEAEFKKRFGGIGAPAYEEMMRTIEQRVADLGVLQ